MGTCSVKKPTYVEVLEFPASVARPSAVKTSDVEVPSLVSRKGDPTDRIHELFAARATVVLQTPSFGVRLANDVNEKSSCPPARTINALPRKRFAVQISESGPGHLASIRRLLN